MKTITSTFILFLFAISAFGQCDTSLFSGIAAKYKSKYDEINKQVDSIDINKPETKPLLVWLQLEDIDFKMEQKKYQLDLISVTMKDKKLSLNVPQVTMRERKMSFDKPETKMVVKKIGQKPEITCNWRGCTVRWKDILTSIPEVTMKRHEIVTKIPEFKYNTTSFITSIPEIKKHRTTMILNVPRVTVRKISAGAKTIDEKAKKITSDADSLAASQEGELALAIGTVFSCSRDSLIQHRTALMKDFAESISQLEQSIQQVVAIGADPTKMKNDAGETINLLALKEELEKSLLTANADFDKALSELDNQIMKKVNTMQGIELAAVN